MVAYLNHCRWRWLGGGEARAGLPAAIDAREMSAIQQQPKPQLTCERQGHESPHNPRISRNSTKTTVQETRALRSTFNPRTRTIADVAGHMRFVRQSQSNHTDRTLLVSSSLDAQFVRPCVTPHGDFGASGRARAPILLFTTATGSPLVSMGGPSWPAQPPPLVAPAASCRSVVPVHNAQSRSIWQFAQPVRSLPRRSRPQRRGQGTPSHLDCSLVRNASSPHLPQRLHTAHIPFDEHACGTNTCGGTRRVRDPPPQLLSALARAHHAPASLLPLRHAPHPHAH